MNSGMETTKAIRTINKMRSALRMALGALRALRAAGGNADYVAGKRKAADTVLDLLASMPSEVDMETAVCYLLDRNTYLTGVLSDIAANLDYETVHVDADGLEHEEPIYSMIPAEVARLAARAESQDPTGMGMMSRARAAASLAKESVTGLFAKVTGKGDVEAREMRELGKLLAKIEAWEAGIEFSFVGQVPDFMLPYWDAAKHHDDPDWQTYQQLKEKFEGSREG